MVTGSPLEAGVARVFITPPVGIPLSGFAGRAAADGIHDELTATALVLAAPAAAAAETGGQDRHRVAFVACDLLFLGAEQIRMIRSRTAQLTGIAEHDILIASSHNHYGPVTDPVGQSLASVPGPQVQSYVENLAYTIAGVVSMAAKAAAPSQLSVGRGEVAIGINRRERTPSGQIILGQNPSGPVDRRVLLLRVDTLDGHPLAAVLNYACHAVSLGGSCTNVTADFIGMARRAVEEQTGATCLFMQGAAGNINPLLMGWDWSHLSRLGLPLGAEAVRVYWNAKPVPVEPGGLVVAREPLRLPGLLPASPQAAQTAISSLEEEERTVRASGRDGELYWIGKRLTRLRTGLAVLEGRAEAEWVDTEITALAMGGGVGLITAPGEIFCEIGQEIVAHSPFGQTFYSGYTNGSVNYVPTRAAYAEGGYEVTHGCIVAPEAGELLAERSIGLLYTVHAQATREVAKSGIS